MAGHGILIFVYILCIGSDLPELVELLRLHRSPPLQDHAAQPQPGPGPRLPVGACLRMASKRSRNNLVHGQPGPLTSGWLT